jgi:hypothetical protein
MDEQVSYGLFGEILICKQQTINTEVDERINYEQSLNK